MSASTLDQVRQIASDIFNVPAETLTGESSPETIENWDSLQHLNLVLDLESRFGLHFSPEEIGGMQNIGTITSLIDRKLDRADDGLSDGARVDGGDSYV